MRKHVWKDSYGTDLFKRSAHFTTRCSRCGSFFKSSVDLAAFNAQYGAHPTDLARSEVFKMRNSFTNDCDEAARLNAVRSVHDS